MKIRNKWWLGACAAGIFSVFLAYCGEPRQQAEEIIKKMEKKYSSCASYRDTGVVTTVFNQDSGKTRTAEVLFNTYLVRPDRFRFDWRSKHPIPNAPFRQSVVWHNGKSAYLYLEPDMYEPMVDLKMAIAGATGVSDGAAYHVPLMLLPDLDGSLSSRTSSPKLVGEETFEGVECYVIEIVLRGKQPQTMWIGKQDFLLRRVHQEKKNDDFSTVRDEIHRKIVLNGEIEEELFQFDPGIPFSDMFSDMLATLKQKKKELKTKEKEAETKGHLGYLKAATAIYYGDHEGVWPPTLEALVPKYIEEIPKEQITGSNREVKVFDGKGGWVYGSDDRVGLNVKGEDSRGKKYRQYGN